MEQRSPGEEDQTARLKRLGDRLREIDKREDGERQVARSSAKDASGLAKGLRMSAEFVAGVGVGVGLGWACDRYFGTSPWGLILFMLLGFGAGMMNVMRAAGALGQSSQEAEKPGEADEK
ncbi:MAG: AtpZ/AtpI family protein [Beijerinckiaceae bacterium]